MTDPIPPEAPMKERLDDETERLLADFRYCALSDTCVDDLSPYTEAARSALRQRISSLISEARKEGQQDIRDGLDD